MNASAASRSSLFQASKARRTVSRFSRCIAGRVSPTASPARVRAAMADRMRVLSIDGGGVRGIIPALVLAEVERRTGKRTAELFDLVTGTSTGGIIALAMTVPGDDGAPRWTADELADLYRTKGNVIFETSV